ncbi:methyl-accepting chemotaxis protein [Nitrosomonas eutropha]|uniref:Methyl-accepting chemotaxis sensory transducer with Pas/Pac sensor n=2 Tax=Nitrosomonas eutropha TaxID=916 RepID=A0ABX5ME21_9PROT|nr:methyl-accepting chemotaxis protein [Nitrosomonas eutropha]ABI59425.1 methyl-accepting chemotaxis sensory transducer with Pas/Pac sensor [Nitrosomonas eutropha C91]PXV83307.1 methyl-accepting chemotaxis sensory transducer with Pas/Pac sensor [Nitrosomonas eutropha]SEI37590.1 methyl-accepting chemotaxis sensory transducer with Pas/Pac sensor [Nitrosomonas eutropha]
MRVNLPVTNVEHEMRDGEFLVSRTTPKGVITYINEPFVRMSGFTEQELIGQAHNIIRHPDMPPEAFVDFWDMLKQGRPWSGMVKNRNQDGGYYWVFANATPVKEHGKVTGHMSVRSKPSRDQIQAAETLYRQMREGTAKVRIVAGKVIADTPLGWLREKFRHLSLKTRIIGAGIVPLLVMAGSAWLMMQDQFSLAFAGMGLSACLAVGMGMWLYHCIRQPLDTMIHHLEKMAQGDYTTQITIERDDEIGKLTEALKSMQIRAGIDFTETKRMNVENLRVRNALDIATSAIMIANNSGMIIFMNRMVREILAKEEDEAEVRKSLQSRLKALASQQQIDNVRIGERTYSLVLMPVTSESGERVGSVVEWRDRTQELTIEREIMDIVQAGVAGDFSKRLTLIGKEGFFRQLAEGINRLMESTSQGLDELASILEAMAEGDLTQKITRDYQGMLGRLKDDSNSTVTQLTGIVAQIKEAVGLIGTASKEIADGNTDLSQRTEQQAANLEKTAASMDELTSTVKQNASNAHQANQLAASASSVAVKGGQVVSEVVQTMSEINDSSKKIVDIISVIDGIAFQTNILALNAAVEAARAGEQGRGFAVVATEVRTLAQRSAAAAKEIKELINNSVLKVEDGTQQVDQAGKTMEEIVQSVKHVTDIMGEISAASQEQSQGIEQVNQAISQMDEITQQNAALVEQAAAASESMREQAEQLSRAVAVFKLEQSSLSSQASNQPFVERRGPNRATNVERLSRIKKPQAGNQKKVAAQGHIASIPTGTGGEWEEF